jgi:predicted PurR-regulated permease PerM
MYYMTGRWTHGASATPPATESEQPIGLRSAMRWLWGRGGASATSTESDDPVGPDGGAQAGPPVVVALEAGPPGPDGGAQTGPPVVVALEAGPPGPDGGAQADPPAVVAPEAAPPALVAPEAGLPAVVPPQAEPPAPVAPEAQVPRLLRQTAAWAWCLLLTGVVIYFAFRLALELRLVVLPFIAALLLTALLQPFSAWLRRREMSPMLSTWCTFLIALVIIAGAITLVATQISADYPTLFAEVKKTATQVQHLLAGPPFHLSTARLSKLTTDVLNYISQHKAVVAGTVLTGGKYALEILAGVVLTLFIAFFLLKDGGRIFKWLISGTRPEAHRRLTNAGDAAWRALVNYMRGTTAVAAIHALFIGLALWLLGVPLLFPFIVLVFLAAYVPIIGILVVGALAVLVALATKGWVAAVILLAVLLLENQIDSHLLQPQVIGRVIRLHPLAIILVLAVGGIVAGIPGAIIAVPTAAVIIYAWPALRGDRPGG